MADTLHLEIVTAGGAAVDTQAAQVTLPLADGEAGVLPGHAPLLGALVSGVVRYTSGGAEHYCAVSPGTVNVAANTVTVLARTAEPAPDIDLPRAEAALRRAESDLETRGMEMNVSAPWSSGAKMDKKRPEIPRTVPLSGLWWGCNFPHDMRKCLRIRLRRHFCVFRPPRGHSRRETGAQENLPSIRCAPFQPSP